jgi:hypothetical protein
MGFVLKYLLPLLYVIILCWLLQRDKKLLTNGVSRRLIILFFLGKCLAGIAYSYVMVHFIPKGDDIALLFGGGLEMYQTFMHSPAEFFEQMRQLFTIDDFRLGHTDSDFIRTVFEGMRFIHFILDLFSFGHLYTNVILFNALAAWLFLRCWVFLKNYLGSWTIGAWVFLFPSAFFYTSGILKEGIEMVLIAAILPIAYHLSKRITFGGTIGFLLLFVLLFFFKFLIAVTFLGVLIIWAFMSKYAKARLWIAGALTIAAVIGFFCAGYIIPSLNLPNYIVERQQEFLLLEANSVIPIPDLEPNFPSFVKGFPRAIINVLFRPLPGDGGKLMYLIYCFEIMAFWILIVYTAIKSRWINANKVPALVWSFFLFAIANLIIIGYSIPNIGAITRYRSIFLPFLGLFFWVWLNGNDCFQKNFRWLKSKLASVPF